MKQDKKEMKYEKYECNVDEKYRLYEFTSCGTKGEIKKIVEYSETDKEGYINLAFGDYNAETNEMQDDVVTNNGDSVKVLSTVASTIYTFTEKYPNSFIVIKGYDNARKRLYRMGISNNLREIKEDFEVYGINRNDSYEKFVIQKKQKDYSSFLITRKK